MFASSARKLAMGGVFLLTTAALTSALAQAADQDATAAPTPLAVHQAENASPPDSASQPDSDAAAQQPAGGPRLGQGTKAEAEHSAEATAHKSLNDPNNQLGTSLQGRTRPIVEANGSQTTAPAAQPAEAPAQ